MSVYLTRRDASKNLSRFYRMLIVPDLFGNWVLLREWGRIGSAGQVKAQLFANAGEALLALQALTRTKVKRGYEPRPCD
jgi:predicted DNA-binding WGR domain protein